MYSMYFFILCFYFCIYFIAYFIVYSDLRTPINSRDKCKLPEGTTL